MTILESLIAMLILGITTTAVTNLIVTGDRIAGRRNAVSCATIIAKNEAERLRAYEKSLVLPKDTSYTEILNSIEFDVTRTWIKNDTVLVNSAVMHREYAITVTRKINRSVSLTFRMLQGYYGETTR
jgi:type II secretory pathway pseudopilin PulG